MSLSDRLGRLLFIVPYVAHRGGVPMAELAQRLSVTPAQIEADLDLLSMVGQPPLTPDHLIDLYVEDDVVYVDLDQSLSRPLRLTHEEARALVLGVRLVTDLGGVKDEIEVVLAKIVAALNPVDRALLQGMAERIRVATDGPSTGAPATVLRRAIDARHVVELDYYSATSDRQKLYRVEPLALVAHTGHEYLVALDLAAGRQEKLYRLDRVGAARDTQEPFEPPAELDLSRFRTQRLYFGGGAFTACVRFSAKVAPAMIERFRAEEVEKRGDGSVLVHVSTSSPAWLARWVLGFGAEAEVIAPAESREYISALCREAALAYRR